MLWENFIAHALLGVLQVVIKNPEKKAAMCAVLIQIRDTITETYPNGCA